MVPLRITLLNIQWLISKNVNKIDSSELKHIFDCNDIVLLTETWSSDLHNYSFNGFECIVLHRLEKKLGSKRDSGGFIIYRRSHLFDKSSIVHKDSDDIIWLGFQPGVLAE